MKKSNFEAMLLGTVSTVLFALGMCMALIPEWNAFRPGVVFSGVGLLLGLVTWLNWRRREKGPIHVSPRTLLTAAAAVAGALTLGVGMCFCMVWGKLAVGIGIGLIGILILLCLIPLVKGLED